MQHFPKKNVVEHKNNGKFWPTRNRHNLAYSRIIRF
jgi:hypothetical protein